MVVPALPLPVSSSVSGALHRDLPAVPTRRSSDLYWWEALKDQSPLPRYVSVVPAGLGPLVVSVVVPSPEPQAMNTVCVSSVTPSWNVPLRVYTLCLLIVIG